MLALGAVSVGTGAVSGVAAGATTADFVAIGMQMGAVVGTMTAPVFAWGMWYESPWRVPAIVAGSAGAVAGCLVLLFGPLAFPFAMLLLAGVFMGLSTAVGIRARERRRRRKAIECEACGYSLVGLASRTCPECGAVSRHARADQESDI